MNGSHICRDGDIPNRSIAEQGAAMPADVVAEHLGETDHSTVFSTLYLQYRPRLVQLCRSILRDAAEAEDATDEVFMKAWQALLGGDHRSTSYPWLRVVARNHCLDLLRRRARSSAVEEPLLEALTPAQRASEDEAIAHLEGELVRESVRRITPDQQSLLQLREGLELSYEEIARREAISLSSVDSRLYRARRAVRKEFLALVGPDGFAAAIWFRLRLRWLGAHASAAQAVATLGERPVPPGSAIGAAVAVSAVAAIAGFGPINAIVHRTAPLPLATAAAATARGAAPLSLAMSGAPSFEPTSSTRLKSLSDHAKPGSTHRRHRRPHSASPGNSGSLPGNTNTGSPGSPGSSPTAGTASPSASETAPAPGSTATSAVATTPTAPATLAAPPPTPITAVTSTSLPAAAPTVAPVSTATTSAVIVPATPSPAKSPSTSAASAAVTVTVTHLAVSPPSLATQAAPTVAAVLAPQARERIGSAPTRHQPMPAEPWGATPAPLANPSGATPTTIPNSWSSATTTTPPSPPGPSLPTTATTADEPSLAGTSGPSATGAPPSPEAPSSPATPSPAGSGPPSPAFDQDPGSGRGFPTSPPPPNNWSPGPGGNTSLPYGSGGGNDSWQPPSSSSGRFH